jgi:hypothetical protein
MGIGVASSKFEVDGNFVGYLAMGGVRTDVMSIGYRYAFFNHTNAK